MAKTLYSVSMSVDGFIAGPDCDMSWLSDYLAPNPVTDDLIAAVGALLVGNRSFTGDDPYKGTPQEGEAFGAGWTGPQFVLTHDLPDDAPPGVTFVDNFTDALAMARAAAGDKYVNVDGVRLFERPGGATVRLESIAVSQAPQATNLWYRVIR